VKAERLSQWLSPINCYNKQNDVLRTRLEGTCLWLLDSPEFKAWTSGTNRTLFCQGIPGSGKTVLASIVVQHIQAISELDSTLGLAWIYGDYKQHKSQTLSSLLGSLIAQLVRRRAARGDPEAWKGVEDLNRACQRNASASANDLSKLLAEGGRHFRRVCIIIDALDECGEDELAREDLLEAVQALPPGAQLFLTSRFIPKIELSVENPLRMEIWARQEDVGSYVVSRINSDRYLRKHCTTDAHLLEEIKRALIDHSGGM
jgi:hypothetical protein